ncbi:MAG TPA: hypothetical protein VH349_14075 [Ktedonobacterales bacterium]|jgi:hypothetical protein
MEVNETQEGLRLLEARERQIPWRQWGPYLSERQWGTVREDYSASGDAWNAFTHDQARSRAYQWGEDGLAGVSDDQQLLCFALALWNGQDPILKERLFGLTNSEGNHGEDVKEYYFYLDSTPTHSYMRYLYKYPQRAYPYDDLVRTNRNRSRREQEYELLDTGVFDEDRYFDIFVTYAKASPTDLLIEIEVANRGPEAADLYALPTLWFRHIWSGDRPRPTLHGVDDLSFPMILAQHERLGEYRLVVDGAATLLFTENETNSERLWGQPNVSPYVKDAFDSYLVHGRHEAVNPALTGTKAAALVHMSVPAGESQTIRLRLTQTAQPAAEQEQAPVDGVASVPVVSELFGQSFAGKLMARRVEADAFYDAITPATLSPDARNVMRQAWAGMLWSKQFYAYDVTRWLGGRSSDAAISVSARMDGRNRSWFHMVNEDVISMPDKWEYPWYAAWDLAFHCIALQQVDPDFAKEQLLLMLHPNYLHPNGQIPAYEWNFSDVNPPVHAWAAWYLYLVEKEQTGYSDRSFLEACFQKLLMNFTWWVNRKDRTGANVFEGGFLGMDNIGVFDRSASLPGGGTLEQADGTAWMAFYAQMMLRIAIELAPRDPAYDQMAAKFFEHVLWIVAAMDKVGEHNDELWDEQDGFFYDVLRFPDGQATRLKVRSMVGLLAIGASIVVDQETLAFVPNLVARARWLAEHRPELVTGIPTLQPNEHGERLLATLDERKLRLLLTRMLDESEFLSFYGIRALSREHLEHPYVFSFGGSEYRVDYEPAESSTGLFGGNSNWRGPIWMPVNILLIRGLITFYDYFGDSFTIECPTGSGQQMTLWQVAEEISHRLASIFLRDAEGRRPVFGETAKFQTDPHWRDYVLFYEYFHGDNGAGIGASHQTGWTGTIAELLRRFGTTGVAESIIPEEERATL